MTSDKALLQGSPIIPFHPALGVAFGICGALILQQIHYWTSMGMNPRDGHNWCYNTYEEWSAQLGAYSAIAVRKTIKELELSGVLVVGVFNKLKYDRTRWYRIDYEALHSHLASTVGSNRQKLAVSSDTNNHSEPIQTIGPIPKTSIKINPETNSADFSTPVQQQTGAKQMPTAEEMQEEV